MSENIDFRRWDVGKLKKFLTEREVPIGNANKESLIALAEFAVQSLEEQNYHLIRQKSLKLRLENDHITLPDPDELTEGCKDGPSCYPELSQAETENYFDRIIVQFILIVARRFSRHFIRYSSSFFSSSSLHFKQRAKEQAVRLHKIVYEAITRLILDDFEATCEENEILRRKEEKLSQLKLNQCQEVYQRALDSPEIREWELKFEAYVSHKRKEGSDLAKFWLSYQDLCQLLFNLLYATRTGGWELYLSCIEEVIPWAFAYDRQNYARYLVPYLDDMRSLPETMPETELVRFLVKEWKKHEFRNRLDDRVLYVTLVDDCWRINSQMATIVPELQSSQEEADTRMLLHAQHAGGTCVVNSDDTDVLVILLGHAQYLGKRHLKKGTGTKTRIIELDQITRKLARLAAQDIAIEDALCGLVGFHALTGCDSVSAFSQKGKWRPLQIVLKNKKYMEAMKEIGRQWSVTEELFSATEELVFHIYGKRGTRVNRLIYELHCAKGVKIEPNALPPYQSSLKLHVSRANYQAAI
ncbi:predicted protein [Nematostella vectensis]|uniref:Uncharacterized protein n=1 Tax=Nematostella vectensis TaxID=45351 RepID=A7RZ22_NEMVE|nr:predicted protein [Nematostella vectensis]|eukprot:XP_001635346.1 predicted protein [Nematostella vectensis]